MPHARESYSQVRLLAAEYAHGYINRAEYIRRRAELIERIVGGEAQLEYVMPEIKPRPMYDDEENFDMGEADFVTHRMPPILPVAIGAGILLVALLVGVWWLLSSPAPVEPVTTGSIERPAMQPGEALLHEFLQQNEWTHASIDALMDGWSAMEADTREAARGTATWRRMQSALRSRVNEQQVLAGYDESGDAAALGDKLRALQERLSRE